MPEFRLDIYGTKPDGSGWTDRPCGARPFHARGDEDAMDFADTVMGPDPGQNGMCGLLYEVTSEGDRYVVSF